MITRGETMSDYRWDNDQRSRDTRLTVGAQ